MISLSGRLLHCYVFTVPILALLGFIARLGGRGLYFFPKWMFKQTERQRNTYRRTAQNQITEQPMLGFSISLRCLMRCVSAATLRI